VKSDIRGILSLSIREGLDFMFKIDILQEQFKPYQAYFKSETT